MYFSILHRFFILEAFSVVLSSLCGLNAASFDSCSDNVPVSVNKNGRSSTVGCQKSVFMMIENHSGTTIEVISSGLNFICKNDSKALIHLVKPIDFYIVAEASLKEDEPADQSRNIEDKEALTSDFDSVGMHIAVSLPEKQNKFDPEYLVPFVEDRNGLFWKLMRPHLDGFLLVFYRENEPVEDRSWMVGPCIQESSF